MEGQGHENGENVGLLVLEPKSFRPFKTKDEYLYAMKEDLAEWFKCLYEEMIITADNFLEVLETGVLLCQHANEVKKFTAEQTSNGKFEMKSNFVRDIQIPQYDVQFRIDVKPGTFLARDNISNFITWTMKIGIPEVLRFETDDLVMRKNERSVVLCLLEVARVGAKFGMLAPTIVQMEEEIDNEIETGEPPPQIKTCDVKSLDEMVRELVGRCTCPIQFPIIKVGEGKYKIGDNQTLVFVRILRKHVMIRVGGGWDTLEHYLDRHDPCRCGFQGHRGGRTPITARRASTTAVSHSTPNTPKSPRKHSIPAQNSHSVTRPASPSRRSASPGPNSRKLNLVVKNSNSQSVSIPSPSVSNKQPQFSNTGRQATGLNTSGKQTISSSGGLNSSGKQSVSSNGGLNSSGKQFVTSSGGLNSSGKQFVTSSGGLNSSGKQFATSSGGLNSSGKQFVSSSGGLNSSGKQATSSDGVLNSSGKQTSLSSGGLNNSGKQTTTSSGGLNTSGKQATSSSVALNNSGSYSLGSFVKQSHANLNRQLSSGSTGSNPPSTPHRSASPAPRSQSPALIRRSESPGPNVSNRLRSPSPAPADNRKSVARPQSATPLGRCSSPMKQITLSELRSSREGKVTGHPQPTAHSNVIRPASVEPTTNRKPNAASKGNAAKSAKKPATGKQTNAQPADTEMDPETRDITIDKISTMSLGDFKNLLNSTLSVPNGAGSQGSSDSPRSQSSVESLRTNTVKPQIPNKSTPLKSAYAYRPAVSNRSGTTKTSSVSSKSVTNSISSDKHQKAYTNSSNVSAVSNKQSPARPRTPSSGQVTSNGVSTNRPSASRSTSNSSLRSSSSSLDQSRLNTTSGIVKSRSNQSSISDTSYSLQPDSRFAYSSRSDSHSSLKSSESNDSYTLDDQKSYRSDRSDRIPLTPSSVGSECSFRNSDKQYADSSGYISARSNSYTPCSINEEREQLEKRTWDLRANSEPRETLSSAKTNGCSSTDSTPLNVGYASFSFNDKDEDTGFSKELSEIENLINRTRTKIEHTEKTLKSMPSTDNVQNTTTNDDSERRPSTPSLIPRPMTPKSTRKISIPYKEEIDNVPKVEDNKSAARPPTPRKSNIIARAQGPRSTDHSKEQSYKEMFQKRSMTPGPGNRSTNVPSANVRRSTTPGPYLQKKSTLSSTTSTTTRARLNQSQSFDNSNISGYEGENQKRQGRTMTSTATARQRSQSVERKTLTKTKSVDDSETVIMVNRSGGQHSLTVSDESRPAVNKAKVLARARTEDNRSKTPAKAGITRQRPQSVEPRQMMQGRKTSAGREVLNVKRGTDGSHEVYDRTQVWVQKAVEQTQVQKPKVNRNYAPKVRRAMTPNSFDMRVDMEEEEPRTLDEIKAALTLPINGLNTINVDALEAPPEDPLAYAEMEKLFHELRQQELKASVNETPGSTANSMKSCKSVSKSSSSSVIDEDMSLDSNKNVKRKAMSISTNSSSNVMSPTLSRPMRTSISSNDSRVQSNSRTPANRPQPASRTSSSSSLGTTSSTARSAPVRTNQHPPRPASPRTPFHSSSPATPRSSNPPRPSSPSPRTSVSSQRPPSPRTTSQTARVAPQKSVPQSPGQRSPSKQPPRPASTPPRPCTPIDRPASRSSDDSDKAIDTGKNSTVNLISKLKEIIKVNPRKDKADGVKQKSRIPAPKSLASSGKSQSFSNLTTISKTMSLPRSNVKSNTRSDIEPELNGYDDINGGLNVTLSGRSETPAPKIATALMTGRSTLIRKESMNKNTDRLSRAVSVERNMDTYQYYDDGEYV